MAIRSQIYEWDASRSGGPKGTLSMPVGLTNPVQTVGKPISIFIGGYGNNLLELPFTSSTQFIVIDEYGCTPSLPRGVMSNNPGAVPDESKVYRGLSNSTSANSGVQDSTGAGYTYISGPRAFIQLRINTTNYFKDPDGVVRDGLPGSAIPYPKSVWTCSMFEEGGMERINVLPSQTWDMRITYYNPYGFAQGGTFKGQAQIQELACFVKYTIYDGSDALIAVKLLQNSIAVTPDNLNWFRARMNGLNYGKLIDKKYVIPPDM